MATSLFNCPNCGAELNAELRLTKLVVCAYCDSSVMIEDEVTRLAGKSGVMTTMPSLFELNRPFAIDGAQFTPIGHARFVYDHGYWDEWWLDANDGVGQWMSVDEGDIAIELPIDLGDEVPPVFRRLSAGERFQLWSQNFLITEVGSATCEAIRGQLPEALKPGDRFDYAHLRGPGVRLITLEFDADGKVSVSDGHWLDPFKIAIGQAA